MFRFIPLVVLLTVLAATGHISWVPVLIAFAVVFAVAPRWRRGFGRRYADGREAGRPGWGC